MKNLALSIGLGVIVYKNKILLIKRGNKPYQGLLGLPGGKIEGDEHLACGLIREIKEETGLKTKLEKYLGIVSELLIEDNEIKEHFLLHICRLYPVSVKIKGGKEGIVDWFNLEKIEKLKEKIIPSDFLIIKDIVKSKKCGYYDCIMEEKKGDYFLKKFEKD